MGKLTLANVEPRQSLGGAVQLKANEALDGGDAPVQHAATGGVAGSDLPGDGGGAPLQDGIRAKMERAFSTDFSAVRIFEGPRSEALGARAHTQGTNIHFAPGEYQPGSASGQELLGHELAHVVQQAQGRVQATRSSGGVAINDDPGLEREADALAARANRGSVTPAAKSTATASPAIQRKTDDEADKGDRTLATRTAGRFIVDDGAIDSERVGRSEFLDQLERAVRGVADEVLAEVGEKNEDCPYINYWFGYYRGQSPAHIERALAKFAPAAATAPDWRACIAAVAERVRDGFRAFVVSGSMAGVPEELPKDLHERPAAPPQPSAAIQLCPRGDVDDRVKWSELEELGARVELDPTSKDVEELRTKAHEWFRQNGAGQTARERLAPIYGRIKRAKARLEAESEEAKERKQKLVRDLPGMINNDDAKTKSLDDLEKDDLRMIARWMLPDLGNANEDFNKVLWRKDGSISAPEDTDIRGLQKALCRLEPTKSKTLWSGGRHFIGGGTEPPKVNAVCEHNGFLPSSTKRDQAEKFGGNLMRLDSTTNGRTIEGVPDQALSRGAIHAISNMGEEAEVLFPFGCRFQYKGVEDGVHVYEEVTGKIDEETSESDEGSESSSS